MTKKKRIIGVILVVLVTASIAGAWYWKFIQHNKPADKPRLKAISKQSVPPQPPAPDNSDRLTIQNIGVDAKISTVGLTKEGNMEAPGNIYDVGLYKYGAKLGQNGTAVLAGHLDGAIGEKGVFYSLDKLKAGDIIKINRNNAAPLTYKVTKSKVYKSTDKPTEVFKSASGANLNLITCTGSWDKNKSQYDERLVVFTTLVK